MILNLDFSRLRAVLKKERESEDTSGVQDEARDIEVVDAKFTHSVTTKQT